MNILNAVCAILIVCNIAILIYGYIEKTLTVIATLNIVAIAVLAEAIIRNTQTVGF